MVRLRDPKLHQPAAALLAIERRPAVASAGHSAIDDTTLAVLLTRAIEIAPPSQKRLERTVGCAKPGRVNRGPEGSIAKMPRVNGRQRKMASSELRPEGRQHTRVGLAPGSCAPMSQPPEDLNERKRRTGATPSSPMTCKRVSPCRPTRPLRQVGCRAYFTPAERLAFSSCSSCSAER